METSYILGCFEGNFTTRAPLFNGSNFNYWKARMTIYRESIDYNLWKVVINGSYVPKRTAYRNVAEKLLEDCGETDKKLYLVNAKAMNILY